MPLPKRLLLSGLVAIIAAPCQAGAANANVTLNWVDRDAMSALPPVYQRPIPAWCGGIYYNPYVGVPAARSDTVVTANHTSITRDGLVEMDGNVLIERPGRRVTTRSALLDQSSGKFEVDSPLRLESNQFTFLANRMSGNTRRGEASLDGVTYALFNLHARGSAKYMDRFNDITNITDGTYSTCPPESNGWQISGSDILLNQNEGWGKATDVTLKVKSVPVLWLPWITFPINDKRKTGLLFPTIATSNGGGLDFTQPIYINIAPQMDATVSPRHFGGRGNGVDTQFRYLTHYGQGQIDYGILFHDRLFNNRNRVLASWKHNGSVGRWQLTADVNYVSDDFYFKDLSTGLDVTSQTELPRLGEARYFGKTWQFLARVQSWQTLDPNIQPSQRPYQRLPQLQLSGQPQLWGPLHATWLSDVTDFERPTGGLTDNPTGIRTHLEPGLTARWSRNWGYIQPSARLYYNQYELNNGGVAGSSPSMSTWGASLDSGLFFERDTNLFGQSYTQTLEPRLFANKVAYQNQSNLPNFDTGQLNFSYDNLFRQNRFIGYDRIGDEEKVAWGLTSRFLNNANGSERLRLRLGQGYYLATRKVQLNGAPPDSSNQTPLVGDVRWNFGRNWYLYSESQWDTNANQSQRSTIRLGYTDRDQRIFDLGFHSRPMDGIRESEVAAVWPIGDNWRLIGRWLYDVDHHRSMETIAGAEWRNCCWRIRLVSQRDLTDKNGTGALEPSSTVMLQIQLTGLGGFGGQVDSLLTRSIPGYRSGYDN